VIFQTAEFSVATYFKHSDCLITKFPATFLKWI